MPRPGPSEPLEAWRRRAERGPAGWKRRCSAPWAGLDHLGPGWHVVEWPRNDTTDLLLDPAQDDRAGFLAIGPGGLFAVTIADHGRARVLVAGDVVQINGKRPPYVAEARRDAKRASKVLSQAVGLPISGDAGADLRRFRRHQRYGLPKDCLMATHRELDRLLVAGGNWISPATGRETRPRGAAPGTWMNGTYRPAGDYRWYDGGRTAADKPANRR